MPRRRESHTINQARLRTALVCSVLDDKHQAEQIWKLREEVDALRDAVRGLDPTFDDVLKRKRKARSKPAKLAAMLAIYDDIIAKLRAGHVC